MSHMNVPVYSSIADPAVAAALLAGKIGVIPSDTQYGLLCSALHEDAVERVYAARSRTASKPCVVLAASFEQLLETPGLDRNTLLMAERYWPGPVSVVVPCKKSELSQVHRGRGSIACRIPDNPALLQLLEQTGLLLAPSANPEDQPPAATCDEAYGYFGDTIDFYVDGGTLAHKLPSTLIAFTEDGLVETLRQGEVVINENGELQ
jgi:L-threonylcarbamoyladenylate synthase